MVKTSLNQIARHQAFPSHPTLKPAGGFLRHIEARRAFGSDRLYEDPFTEDAREGPHCRPYPPLGQGDEIISLLDRCNTHPPRTLRPTSIYSAVFVLLRVERAFPHKLTLVAIMMYPARASARMLLSRFFPARILGKSFRPMFRYFSFKP
jgi:hypothetical protein